MWIKYHKVAWVHVEEKWIERKVKVRKKNGYFTCSIELVSMY
jgi:hypothetical protein